MALILPNRRVLGVQPRVIAGAASWTSPGTYSFVIPRFNTLIVDVRGAGGGGSGAAYYFDQYNFAQGGVGPGHGYGGDSGAVSGYAYFEGSASGTGGYGRWIEPISGQDCLAYGGGGTRGGTWFDYGYQGTHLVEQGGHGQGYGGNWTNNAGGAGNGGQYGYNGNCYSPQTGGYLYCYGGWGGHGGQAVSHFTWAAHNYLFNRTATVVVGGGGANGGSPINGVNGNIGGAAAVYVSWS